MRQAYKQGGVTEKAFELFVQENCGNPEGGTASSYRTAIAKLKMVFERDMPSFVRNPDVWAITDPAEVMRLYELIKVEQDKFINSGSGIFAPYAGRGDSYYRKRWCSAALRFFAQFRAAEGYEAKFHDVLSSSDNGTFISSEAEKVVKQVKIDWCLPEDIDPKSKQGKEAIRETKARIGQQAFRNWILSIYNGKCCVTGLDLPELLRASHIVAWAEDKDNRMNPANGLCLSATYDAAFDKHLITFDDNYRMVLSKTLRDHCTAEIHREYFLRYEGKEIAKPSRFLPDLVLLHKHQERLAS